MNSGKAVAELGGVKDDCMRMLRGLDREDLEEVMSQEFCHNCLLALHTRLQTVTNRKLMKKVLISPTDSQARTSESSTKTTSWGSKQSPGHIYSQSGKGYADKLSPLTRSPPDTSLANEGLLSEEQNEHAKVARVGRKKNFVHMEKVNGKETNVLQGLELHTRVFDADEQKKIVECVYDLQRKGQKGQLRERTYTEPSKWMRGKGRVTIQFGCCYNYAVDKNGNPPGIIRDEYVDPLPPVFKQMIKRLVKWHVLPPTCVPNSCIVNLYDEGDCIPPHIDHHDFLRPFCTVSFLTECNILFGGNLKILGPGEFAGPASIPLPTGSVLILNGNGADIAKHCVPAVPTKRISITFRKMDESRIPYNYQPDPELQGIKPLLNTPLVKSPSQQNNTFETKQKPSSPSFVSGNDDFPPLGSANSGRQRGNKKNMV